MVDFQKNSIEWQLMNDFWSVWKEYGKPILDNAYWDSLVNKAKEIEQKYKHTKVADLQVAMFVGLLEHLEKEVKELYV